MPLGVKAVVAAIYEPPQHGSDDGLELLDDPHAPAVEKVAAGLGLRKVGWVFTDLEPEDLRAGTVKHKRYIRYMGQGQAGAPRCGLRALQGTGATPCDALQTSPFLRPQP